MLKVLTCPVLPLQHGIMNRRDFLKAAALAGLGALVPGRAFAMGEDAHFTIAKLQYAESGWDPRPSALRRLLLEVEKRTSIKVDTDVPAVNGLSADMFEHPFLALAGDSKFDPLPDKMVTNLRTYMKSGGFLMVDSAEGVPDGPFMKSVERELGRILPDKKLAPIPKDHVLYKSFYLIDQPLGRVKVASRMRAIFDEDRLLAVVCPNDLMGAWARDNFGNWRYSVSPGGEQQREMAFRLGINFVMYALCINYKADQVHVPFILKRRQWKVD
ncbi:DUF4159 domain-containing protein [Persicimonas caeni]|uniref:DUF4159 domain-containing protein n=2 Tax=Persicimonas caeni TaxID=2292766 RepID=A0A4Y6PNA2_PERCE|nr:DUF4159 domain-containing protein [Persicimonas caeni]QED30941.1 DUF4159 domain-containing protein [Persicimonas caeni]